MAELIYTIFFVVSFAMLLLLVAQYRNRISGFYILLFVSVIIANFGYMQLASAENVEMAVYGNQICYLGSSFSPFLLMMCIADLCKVKVPGIAQLLCVTYSVIIFAFVSTIGSLPWYYKSVSFAKMNGIGILQKEYGPLHMMYPFYLLIITIMSLAFIINAFRRRKDVSYINSFLVLLCLVVNVSIYVLEKVLHMKVEILPFAYVVAQGVILFLLRRISMYEVSVISANAMVESLAYGFLLCDGNGKYLGSDEAAKLWFPEVANLAIDMPIKAEETPFLQQVMRWVHNEDYREMVYIEQGQMIMEVKHSILKERKKNSIHCFYLRDDTQQQQYKQLVKQYNENLEHDVEAKTKRIKHIQDDIIISMASIVENRDNNTGGHIVRTSDIVKIFVDHLLKKEKLAGLDEEMAERIIKAAPLHDFGKIAIPDVILNKPGKFTEEEYSTMKQHSAKGAVIVERILQNSDDLLFKSIAVNVAHYHHEKWNGKGYPEGLKGEKIPFEARIMALADVFDALVSKRVYKESFGYDKAFDIIEESCGSHFDPDLCQAFLKCRPRLEALYDTYHD